MKPKQLLLLEIVKSDGLKPSGNLLPYSIQAKYPNGTCQRFDLPGLYSRPSEAVQVGQTLLMNCLSFVSKQLAEQKEGS